MTNVPSLEASIGLKTRLGIDIDDNFKAKHFLLVKRSLLRLTYT